MSFEIFYLLGIVSIPFLLFMLKMSTEKEEAQILAQRHREKQQILARRSPYSKGYKAFDLTQKQPGRQSFVLGLLENPMFYKKVKGEKQYRIHFIMQEVMLTYSSQWRFHDIVPRKNNEDEEQFWMGARDAILHYINKDIKSQEVRANSLDRAEKRQKAIDELY